MKLTHKTHKEVHGLFHASQLCKGQMELATMQGLFGPVSGWRCTKCGKFMEYGVMSLQHKSEPAVKGSKQ